MAAKATSPVITNECIGQTVASHSAHVSTHSNGHTAPTTPAREDSAQKDLAKGSNNRITHRERAPIVHATTTTNSKEATSHASREGTAHVTTMTTKADTSHASREATVLVTTTTTKEGTSHDSKEATARITTATTKEGTSHDSREATVLVTTTMTREATNHDSREATAHVTMRVDTNHDSRVDTDLNMADTHREATVPSPTVPKR